MTAANPSTSAAVNSFNGPGTSWDVNADWTDSGVNLIPGLTDALLINSGSLAAGATETLDGSYSVQTLSFDIGSGSININANAGGTTGQTLTLTGGTNALGTTDLIDLSSATTGTANIGVTGNAGITTVALGASGNISVNNASATLDFGANSIISGAFNLSKSGAGTLVLAGANTFGGNSNTFTLSAGTLDINNASALGDTSNTLVISGGTIDNTSGAAITTSNYAETWGGNFTFTGTNALNLGTGAVGLGSATRTVTVNGTGVNGTLTVGGVISGTGGLTKSGTGTLVLTGVDTYTGATTVNGGVLTYSGSGGLSAGTGAGLTVSGASGALLNIAATGSLGFSSTSVGAANAPGAIVQASGTFTAMNASSVYMALGNGGYGSYTLNGGTFNASNSSGVRVGVGSGGQGVFLQTGGTVNLTRYFAVGFQTAAATPGTVTVTGGTLNGNASFGFIVGNSGGNGVMNLGTQAGGAGLIVSNWGTGLEIDDANGGNGTLNLNSGTLRLTAGSIVHPTATGTSTVNFNGGTLQAAGAGLTLIGTTLSAVNVYNRGATFDTQTNTATVSANLLAPTGNGIYPAGGTLAVASGGSGYIGAPLVAVSGGSGTGAMAIANISGGVITGVTLTNPGQNFQVGDQLSFTFTGGGASSPVGSFQYALTAADIAANNSGGVTKLGAGTLTLSGANTYTGPTTVQGGTLVVGGASALGTGRVNMTGGTLNLSGHNATLNSIASTVTTSVIQNASATPVTLTTGGDNTSTTYASVLADGTGGGSLSVVKTGSGALTLSGTNTYTGTTAINGGVLNVNGSLASPSVSVAGSAGIGGSGTLNGSVTVNNGGVINAGYQGLGALSIANLTLGATAGDLATVNLTAGATEINVGGTLTLNGGAGSVTLNVGGAAPSIGQYPLVAYGSMAGTGYSAFTLGTLPNRVIANLVNNTANNSFDLNVTGVDFPVWTGALGSEWSANTLAAPKNWVLNSNHANKTDYLQGDSVLFDDTATGSTTINIGVANVSPGAVTFANSTLSYTLMGGFGIAGGAALTKTGGGMLTISNTNSFTGPVNISNSGVISVASVANAGVPSPLGAGTTINVDSGMLSFTGASGSTDRNIMVNSGGMILDIPGNLILTGGITGSGVVSKISNGALTLAGANGLSGGLNLYAGQLNINNPAALGTGTFAINGGSIDNTSGAPITISTNNAQAWAADFTFIGSKSLNLGTGPVTLSSDRTLTVSANTLTVGGVISGSAGLTKAGNGTLLLAAANTYTGSTNVNAGVLQIGGNTSVPTASLITVASGGTFDTNANGQAGRNVLTIAGTGAPGQLGAIVNTSGANEGSVGNVTLNGDASVGTSGGKLDFYGTISGGYTLTAAAGSTAIDVRTTNSISGLTAFIVNSPVISEASQSWAGPYTVNAGGALGGYNSIAYSGSVTLNGGTLFANGNNFTTTFGGSVTVQSASTIGSTSIAAGSTQGGSNITVSNAISGPGGITFGGSKITTLGASNSYNGGTTITGGTVVAGATDVLGTGGLTMSGGTFTLNGNNTTVASLSSTVTTATIQNANATAVTLTVGASNASTSYTSTLVDGTGGGALALTKNGNGALTLSGTNTYTGPTTVNGGALVVTGSISGSTVSVNGGATLAGTGALGGAVTTSSGGTIAPGVNGLGTLTVNNAVIFASASTFSVCLGGVGSGQVSVLNASGINLNGDGGTGATLQLNLVNGYVPAGGDLLVIALNSGSESGGFAGTSVDSNPNYFGGASFTSFVSGGIEYAVSYNATATSFTGGTGIALMAIPEPTSLALLASLTMPVGLLRFRRRRA